MNALRRYTPLKPSKGTVWPPDVRSASMRLHGGRCIGPTVGMPGACEGSVELDHIRASGAIGRKSPSTVENAAPLCGHHHRLKGMEGRTWRPFLIALVEARMAGRIEADCGHVEPSFDCPGPCNRAEPLQLGETA